MAQDNINSFRFLRLKILQDCKVEYVRNLEVEKDYYFIDGSTPCSFFGKGVNVSAIVGKNGSGKSSLLNLIYLVLNNVGTILADNEYPKPQFVKGVCVELWFEVDNQECVIACLNDEICFRGVGTNRWAYSFTGKLNRCLLYGRFRQASLSSSGRKNALDRFSNSFPYTITSNYSMMGFVGEDMNNVDNAKWMINAYEQCRSNYQYPLQLLPWKVRNCINFEREKKESNQRMLVTTLMLSHKGCNILPEYEYRDMLFEYSNCKCQQDLARWNKHYGLRVLYDVTDNTIERNVVGVVLNYLGIPQMSGHELRIRIMKILLFFEVVKQLPSSDQENICRNFLRGGVEFNAPYLARKICHVCDNLKKNLSWNAHEFHRLYNFLSNTNTLPTFMKGKFSYQEYYDWLSHKAKKDNQKCVFSESIRLSRTLPPSCFDAEIIYADAEGAQIPVSDFSGGQKQFVYQVSTILYHIFNVMPAHKVEPKYRMFNIIIDEVELCLHPDYQRSYLYWLLNILERLNMKDAQCRYNIMLVTHSPFVLSDIPTANLLCLERGESKKNEEVLQQTFCANVYDLLSNQFFMKQFIGDFAAKKLDELVEEVNAFRKYAVNNSSEDNRKMAKILVDKLSMIGDDFIRENLRQSLYSYLDNDRDIKLKRLKDLEREADILRKELEV